jgi:outer membrane protein assembly factor BamB
VIVQADVHGGSFLAAYDLESGNEVWRTAREGEIPTFATPTVFRGPTGDEIVTNGTRIRGYDAKTGALLWHLGPNSEIPVGSPVVTGELIYVTAGYPPIKPIYAIRPGSRGDLALPEGAEKSEALAWSKTRGGTYIPSPLVYRGYFYTNENNGLLVCYDATTGELVYRARIGGTGGSYAASPIAADGRLYFTTEEGETFVVEAGPEYRLLAKNRVEGVVLSTPAASDGLLVIRTLDRVHGIANP